MNFDATGDTFRGLLTATRVYQIPRFQRDFSWEKSNNEEFLDDLVGQVRYDNEKKSFDYRKYYLGNMIFLGTKDKDSVKVIDGQQRLTSGTILLAALRDSFKEISEIKDDIAWNYADTIQSEYLVKKIDGYPQRKLETTTTFPYFAETIQGMTSAKDLLVSNSTTSEEEMLKSTFQDFKKKLQLPTILKYLYEKDIINDKKKTDENKKMYVSFLKAIRDTFLGSEIVEIFVADDNEAYRIFENINSKGKPLTQVDLIKNDIFSRIKLTDYGVDTPVEIWKQINLTLSKLDTNFNEFFLHFWKSKYPKDSANGSNLYKKYIRRFRESDSDEDLKILLKNIRLYSQKYAEIISPSAEKYKTQESKPEYRSLDAINKFHGIQSRVPLLTLFIKREDIKLKSKKVNEFLLYLANFHFAAFGTSLSIRGNLTTGLYKSFCISLLEADDASKVYTAMTSLEKKLSEIIPKSEFTTAFTQLNFSKRSARNSLYSYPASYAIKTIANKLDNRSFDDDEYTIEHIIDEDSDNESTTNIGNLTVLERKYNDELSLLKKEQNNKEITYKKDTYKKSNYNMTKKFFSCYSNYQISDIETRSEKLSDFFWDNFLKTE